MKQLIIFASLFRILLASPANLSAQESQTLIAPLSALAALDPILTLTSQEYRPVAAAIEFLDKERNVVARWPDFAPLEPLESRSFSMSTIAPDGTASMRIVSDGSLRLSATYSLDGVSAQTVLGDSEPAMREMGFGIPESEAVDASAALPSSEASVVYAANANYCGNQSSSGNPFSCDPPSNGGNCTWWAWKMASENWRVDLPTRGNAAGWAKEAAQAGYRVSLAPAVGTIGVSSTLGKYGHVFWVNSLNNGQVCGTEMSYGTAGVKSRCWPASVFDQGFIYPPSVAVLAPAAFPGWVAGQLQTVRWSYTGDIGALVSVDLVDRNPSTGVEVVYRLADALPVGSRGSGSLLFRVPFVKTNSWSFRLRVTSRRDGRYSSTSPSSFQVKNW